MGIKLLSRKALTDGKGMKSQLETGVKVKLYHTLNMVPFTCQSTTSTSNLPLTRLFAVTAKLLLHKMGLLYTLQPPIT